MRPLLVACLVVLGCALCAPSLGRAASAPDPSTVFTDPVGDAAFAPDVASVKVSNDVFAFYAFHVELASVYDAASGVIVAIDSDKNANTGDPDMFGADYAIGGVGVHRDVAFFVWNGSTWVNGLIDSSIFVRPTIDGRALNMSISSGDIGRSASFRFFVLTFAFAVDPSTFDLYLAADFAPDADFWTYAYQAPFSIILASSTSKVHSTTHRWEISALVKRSDTSGYLGQEATITCAARAAGKKLAVVRQEIAAAAGGPPAGQCAFRTPKKGTAMTGTITMAFNGAIVTKTFTARS